jgi:hypothetical protein
VRQFVIDLQRSHLSAVLPSLFRPQGRFRRDAAPSADHSIGVKIDDAIGFDGLPQVSQRSALR